MDQALEVFDGFATFSPIINGIGGNLVSVQSSKMSTMLHQSSPLGLLPPRAKILEYPWKALFRGGMLYKMYFSCVILFCLEDIIYAQRTHKIIEEKL